MKRDIALYKYEGNFYALDNQCVHRGGQLGDGHMSGANVICPLHQWDYDVRTGVSRYDESEKVAVYPVQVIDDRVEIDADAVTTENLVLIVNTLVYGHVVMTHSNMRCTIFMVILKASMNLLNQWQAKKRDYAGFWRSVFSTRTIGCTAPT